MNRTNRLATLAAIATLALAVHAPATVPAPDISPVPAMQLPSVAVQIEIRGLNALFTTIDRLSGTNAAPGQLRAMFTGMGTAFAGISPFELIDATGTSPVRAFFLGTTDNASPRFLFDLPVAAGGASAFFDRLSAAWTEGELPEPADALLPADARVFQMPAAGTCTTYSLLFLPHGDRMAMLPYSHGGLPPALVADFLSSVPSPSVEGQLAVRVNLAALATALSNVLSDFLDDLHANQAQVDQVLATLVNNPVTACEYGIGLDSSDRLRLSFASDLRPGSATARIYTGIGAPASPLANAILFPDALAAFSEHSSTPTEEDLSAWLAEQIASNPGAATDPAARALMDKWASRGAALGAALNRHHDGDLSFALLPPSGGVSCPWALYVSSPDAPAFLDALPAFVNDNIDALVAFLPEFLGTMHSDLPPNILAAFDAGKINLRLAPAGECTLFDLPVRTFALVLSSPEKERSYTLFTFDAAAAGPALLLSDLPEETLASVLSDLASGATQRPALTDLPAFADAYGPAAPDAATGYIRLLPAARTLLRAANDRLQTITPDSGDPTLTDAIDLVLAWVPDVTLAFAQRWIPEKSRLAMTCSLPLPEIQAAIERIRTAILSKALGAD